METWLSEVLQKGPGSGQQPDGQSAGISVPVSTRPQCHAITDNFSSATPSSICPCRGLQHTAHLFRDGVPIQGKEDKVVPPNQAEDMYKGLKERGVTTGLVLFDGEQHGFRGSNAIRRAMEVRTSGSQYHKP